MNDYENTTLWRSTLGAEDEARQEALERLRSSFRSFRSNIDVLVSRISSELPDLTVHDITHLDALWETASIIVGEQSGFNPLEGYVLGGAILLHDSAHCAEAFDGGAEAVRASQAWTDAMSAEQLRWPDGVRDLEADADFLALRQLHADQAAELPGRCWQHPDNGSDLYLIEDVGLRQALGGLIGKIAASHHWDIESVVERLPSQFNSPGDLPADWVVDPVRVACLLRCADAAHLDARRSPHLLYALLRRAGLSRDHWRAQNRLARVARDKAEPRLLRYNSTAPFSTEEYTSWWVAHDAIRMVHNELSATDSLLINTGRSPFAAKGVANADNPTSLAEVVETVGWTPTTAMPHVNNVESVVKRLGGEQLYGAQADQFQVVLRELIQNARDALVARSALDPRHESCLWVDVDQTDGGTEVRVSDNGVGMSERVLTGSLLEFGQSFWSSDLVRSEFPGLLSSSFRPVGKYGIGFYSIFMIAEEATITSRRWSEGAKDARRLRFPDGLTMRPLLELPGADEVRSDATTVVSIRVRSGLITDDLMMPVTRRTMDVSDLVVPLSDFIAAVSAGVDVPIFLQTQGSGYHEIHTPQPVQGTEERTAWWKRVSFAAHQPSPETLQLIENEVSRLRPLEDDNNCYGLAAVSTVARGVGMACTLTVGGLAADIHNRSDSPFYGWIDRASNSAKRDASQIYAAPAPVLAAWLEEQEELLSTEQNPLRRVFASGHFLSFDYVPDSILTVVVAQPGAAAGEFANMDRLIEIAEQTSIGIYTSSYGFAETNGAPSARDDAAIIIPVGAGRCDTKLEEGEPLKPNSLLSLIHNRATALGHNPTWTLEENGHENQFGQPVSFLRLRLESEPRTVKGHND